MVSKDFIKCLIDTKEETEICDFKREWPKSLDGIIKDIICFSNRVEEDDAYIIFGVDDNKTIVGLNNQDRKFNQNKVIDYLRTLPFETRPNINLETITIDGYELDILTIHNCNLTPVYLLRDYKSIRAGVIYTRVKDTNSPSGEQLEPKKIERLWMKRFNMLNRPNPKQLFFRYLKNLNGLYWEKGTFPYKENIWEWFFLKDNPLYKICLIDDKMERSKYQTFSISQYDASVFYKTLLCMYGDTPLKSVLLVCLDGGRFYELCPEQFVYENRDQNLQQQNITVDYFIINSEEWIIREAFIEIYELNYNNDSTHREDFFKNIICFYDEYEKNEFVTFLKNTYSKEFIKPIDTDFSHAFGYDEHDQSIVETLKKNLRYMIVIKKIYEEWKKNKTEKD